MNPRYLPRSHDDDVEHAVDCGSGDRIRSNLEAPGEWRGPRCDPRVRASGKCAYGDCGNIRKWRCECDAIVTGRKPGSCESVSAKVDPAVGSNHSSQES